MNENTSFRLSPSTRITPSRGPLLLVIMDGVGQGLGDAWDAVTLANTPTLDWLLANAGNRLIQAHGTAVGLPSDADMGNSEVGHNALGAGRVVDQGAKLVNEAIRSRSIFGETWNEMVGRSAKGGTLHLIGLLSDGNVHSHEDHLHALIREAAAAGVRRLRVHALLDGRDVPATSALVYVERLEAVLAEASAGGGRDYRVASGGGRMGTTMDRYEADWSIVERGWQAHVLGQGRAFTSATAAIETFRAEQAGIQDQFLPAFVIAEGGTPVGTIEDGDSVILYNFRGDRAVELCRAFEEGPGFAKFDRVRCPAVLFAGMTLYDGDLHLPGRFLVPPPEIDRTLTQYLCGSGVTQVAISETQKFGHVTYFWNGNRSGKVDAALETYLEIPSDKVPFEQRPWMKAAEITEAALEALRDPAVRFVRLNFANGDMVGHTGSMQATRIAVEAVDLCLARLLAGIQAVEGTLIVTADHGNADDMVMRDSKGKPTFEKDGQPKVRTSHSLNPVLFVVYRKDRRFEMVAGPAGLANVAATVTELLGLQPPDHFERSLIA